MSTKSNLTARPGLTPRPSKSADDFIAGAPDAAPGRVAMPVSASVDTVPDAAREQSAGGRKKPISLTIDPEILAQLDRKARSLGLSRAGAFSLAVTRFLAQEDRDSKK